jgi:TRAP-type C4-dicarboxylate transport system substrate-binding protein
MMMKRVAGLVAVAALVATASFLAGRASVEADESVTLVVRHKVASFAKWKPVFDGHEAFRKRWKRRSTELNVVKGPSFSAVAIRACPRTW